MHLNKLYFIVLKQTLGLMLLLQMKSMQSHHQLDGKGTYPMPIKHSERINTESDQCLFKSELSATLNRFPDLSRLLSAGSFSLTEVIPGHFCGLLPIQGLAVIHFYSIYYLAG